MNTKEFKTIFVSESIANKLKSIGFDSKCLLRQDTYHHDKFTYIALKENQEIYYDYDIENKVLIEDLKLVKNSKLPKDNISLYKDYKSFVTIPTYEQAFKWFREKGYEINISFDFQPNLKCPVGYCFEIIHNCSWETFKSYYNSYEIAREECLKELIKIYEKKNKV